jgi:hypothetical protein
MSDACAAGQTVARLGFVTLSRTLMPLAAAAALLIGGSLYLSPAREPAAAPAQAACVRARIAGSEWCLTAGRPCDPRYERRYEHSGFKCRRNNAGQYRLWQALRPGQPRV